MSIQRTILKVEGHHRPGSPVCELAIAGDLLFTSLCGPSNVLLRKMEDVGKDFKEDTYWLFNHLQRNVEAAGGSVDSILDMAIYVNVEDPDGHHEAIMHDRIREMFPDAGKRPAIRVINISPGGTHWLMAGSVIAALPNSYPFGSTRGRLVYSPLIIGREADGHLPDDPKRQGELMFEGTRKWVEGGGGTVDDIINVMVYMQSEKIRKGLDEPWAAVWPDRENLPARQTIIRPRLLGEGVAFGALSTAIV